MRCPWGPSPTHPPDLCWYTLPGLPAITDISLSSLSRPSVPPAGLCWDLTILTVLVGRGGRWILVLGVGGSLMDEKPLQESPCKRAVASF